MSRSPRTDFAYQVILAAEARNERLPGQRKLARQIGVAVATLAKAVDRHNQVKGWLADLLPKLQERERRASAIIKSHKGIMSKSDYRKLLALVHPDRVMDPELKRAHTEMFTLLRGLEVPLLPGEAAPTEISNLSVQDMMLRRRGSVHAPPSP